LKDLTYFRRVNKKHKNMEAPVLNQPLNDTQMFVLHTFATAKNEQDRDELTLLYLQYLQKKLDAATDKWWIENEMTNEKLNEILNTHYRTPYRQ
jgi:hypothetical protein